VFVATPAELFVRIGLRIREGSPYALTIPAAYCNAAYPNYIGTSEDVGDREYMSAFFRHAMKPPYRKPAGDVIADTALVLLQQMMEAQKMRARARQRVTAAPHFGRSQRSRCDVTLEVQIKGREQC